MGKKPSKPKMYSVHGKPMGRKPKPPGSPKLAPHGHHWKKGEVTNPNGRPSTFTEETGERIVELLWSGECRSLVAVSRLDGMPTYRTIHNWTKSFPDFGIAVLEARYGLAEHYSDDIDVITDGVLDGTIGPQEGQVAIKSKQWKAIVTDPSTFGNKSYVEKNENVKIEHTYIDRIDISQLSEDERDAIESALEKTLMLTGPRNDGVNSSSEED